ncbi:MAG TPA: peptide deformylase [Bacteroidales bacterium]|nr:peptide deformylase [Bacteroidales bacterium]HPS16560.1 peptide deformylase [Bacteroidales bacterium]
MILPIYSYGHAILKKKAEEIGESYPNLNELIENMFETMYAAPGVGLAAPQVGLPIRLIVIDATAFADDDPELEGVKLTLINAKIIEEEGEEWLFNEGCLSFPTLREDVLRKPKIRMQYYDKDFKFHDRWFDGILARIIQHEYDHTEGKVFVDRLSSLKKQLIKGKLNDIMTGNVNVSYRMKFSKTKKK